MHTLFEITLVLYNDIKFALYRHFPILQSIGTDYRYSKNFHLSLNKYFLKHLTQSWLKISKTH